MFTITPCSCEETARMFEMIAEIEVQQAMTAV